MIKRILIQYVAIMATGYLIGSFYNINFNILDWSDESRASFAAAAAIVSAFTFIYSLVIADDDNDKWIIP